MDPTQDGIPSLPAGNYSATDVVNALKNMGQAFVDPQTITGAMVQALKAPGQAVQSTPENPVTTEQLIKPAADLAGVAMTGAIPAAEKGALGIFGGKLAQGADLSALNKAKELAANGATRDQIWNDTGWFQGHDSQWRFEIPDNMTYAPPDAIANAVAGKAQGTAYDNIRHPELYNQYPHLKDLPITNEVPQGAGAVSNGGSIGVGPDFPKENDYRSTMLHELQHEIAGTEGFMRGSGDIKVPESLAEQEVKKSSQASSFIDYLHGATGLDTQGKHEILANLPNAELSKVWDRAWLNYTLEHEGNPPNLIHEYLGNFLTSSPQGRKSMLKDVDASHDFLTREAARMHGFRRKVEDRSNYWNQASEVESRNVEKRMEMSQGERKRNPPWTTEDVPREKQTLESPWNKYQQMLQALKSGG